MKIIGSLIIFSAAILCYGWGIMLLWNWLIPEIFGLTVIMGWQALGLGLLGGMLFGWGGGKRG